MDTLTIDYPFEVQRLAPDDGGGYLITFPDLPGCMADGGTVDEAIQNGRDAVVSWIRTAQEFGDPIPQPGSGGEPVRFVQRLPRSLHAKLVARAKADGVSLNTMVVALQAEGVGRHSTN